MPLTGENGRAIMRTTALYLMLLIVAGGTAAPATATPATHCPPPVNGYVVPDPAEPNAVDNFVDDHGNGKGMAGGNTGSTHGSWPTRVPPRPPW
jgi:hypothetical protein